MTLLLFAHCRVDAIQPIMQKTGVLYRHIDIHVLFYVFDRFSYFSVNSIVKMTFLHFITCNEYM